MKKEITLIAYVFPKLQTAEKVVKQMSQKPRFRTPFDKQHGKRFQTLLLLSFLLLLMEILALRLLLC